ncbi:MAG: OmpA family protein [Pseudomonadales bacterium]|nr:OmpA family protein [Pseudomonadales bacterium]
MNKLYVALLAALLISACTEIPDTAVDHYQFDDISDDDADGVINARDICRRTPARVQVDNQGCTDWDVREKIDYIQFYFAFDSDQVTPDGQQGLKLLASKLKQNPDFAITVIGDTSPEGSIAYNLDLAHRRADAVSNVLLANGVAPNKIDTHYFTETIPLVSDYLSDREHRVVALLHSPDYTHKPKWNIFTTEDKLKAKARK